MRDKVYLWSYIALTALYATLSLRLPSDPAVLQRYNITQSRAHLVNLTIVVPLIFVWSAAVYGFIRFQAYARTIEKTAEGEAFRHLANGLTILAFSLPILACVSSLTNYFGFNAPELKPTLVIIKNYISLLFPILAFMQIVKGAERLTHTLKRKILLPTNNLVLLGIITLSSFYVLIITSRSFGPTGSDISYHLPNWLIVATIAIPYVFVWCKGVQAAIYLSSYQKKTRGKAYKQALRYLSQGIFAIIILSISIQLILTLSAQLTRLHLTPLLGIVYFLVALYAVGYGLVARGANKLKLIEEV